MKAVLLVGLLVLVGLVASIATVATVANAQTQAYLVVGRDYATNGGAQYRAAPLCRLGYNVPGFPGVNIPVIVVAEDRYDKGDNWTLYYGYEHYNIYNNRYYTVTQKIATLPYNPSKIYRPPNGYFALFYFIIYNNTVYTYKGEKLAVLPSNCNIVKEGDGDGVVINVYPVNWTPPSTPTPTPTPPATTTPEAPSSITTSVTQHKAALGIGALLGLLLFLIRRGVTG